MAPRPVHSSGAPSLHRTPLSGGALAAAQMTKTRRGSADWEHAGTTLPTQPPNPREVTSALPALLGTPGLCRGVGKPLLHLWLRWPFGISCHGTASVTLQQAEGEARMSAPEPAPGFPSRVSAGQACRTTYPFHGDVRLPRTLSLAQGCSHLAPGVPEDGRSA